MEKTYSDINPPLFHTRKGVVYLNCNLEQRTAVDEMTGLERIEFVYDSVPVDAKKIPTELTEIKSILTTQIKAQAMKDILAIAPEWKQRNMLARGLELQHKGAVNWSAAERVEIDAIQAIWAEIKAVRDNSDVGEKQINEAASISELPAL